MAGTKQKTQIQVDILNELKNHSDLGKYGISLDEIYMTNELKYAYSKYMGAETPTRKKEAELYKEIVKALYEMTKDEIKVSVTEDDYKLLSQSLYNAEGKNLTPAEVKEHVRENLILMNKSFKTYQFNLVDKGGSPYIGLVKIHSKLIERLQERALESITNSAYNGEVKETQEAPQEAPQVAEKPKVEKPKVEKPKVEKPKVEKPKVKKEKATVPADVKLKPAPKQQQSYERLQSMLESLSTYFGFKIVDYTKLAKTEREQMDNLIYTSVPENLVSTYLRYIQEYPQGYITYSASPYDKRIIENINQKGVPPLGMNPRLSAVTSEIVAKKEEMQAIKLFNITYNSESKVIEAGDKTDYILAWVEAGINKTQAERTQSEPTAGRVTKKEIQEMYSDYIKILRNKITDIESYRYKVFEKRALSSQGKSAKIMKLMYDLRQEVEAEKADVVSEVIMQLGVNAKPRGLTNKEQQILLETFDEVVPKVAEKLQIHIPNNRQVNILKLVRIKEVKENVKYYDDLTYFKEQVAKAIQVATELYSSELKSELIERTKRYETAKNEYIRLLKEVCTFNDRDQVVYDKIQTVIARLPNYDFIDGITYVDEMYTVIISYKDGEGMFMVNPYVILEPFRQRVLIDRTKLLKERLTDSKRLNREGAEIGRYLLENLAQHLRVRSKVNIITKPVKTKSDATRIKRMLDMFDKKGDNKQTVQDLGLQVKAGLDENNKPNRINVMIGKGSSKRKFMVSPMFVYDVDKQEFIYIRESPKSTVVEFGTALQSKPQRLEGVEPTVAKQFLTMVLYALDLRRTV